MKAFEADETSRFTLVSQETAGLKEKVRIIDDEFSKRVKAIESILQREAYEHDKKHTQIEMELKSTIEQIKEIAQHTEQQNKKRIDEAEKALAQT